MVRLGLFVLLVVAAAIAYPWAAAAVVGVVILVLSVRARTRRGRPTVRRGGGVSLDRRVALRAARRELRSIERAAGLPPSPEG